MNRGFLWNVFEPTFRSSDPVAAGRVCKGDLDARCGAHAAFPVGETGDRHAGGEDTESLWTSALPRVGMRFSPLRHFLTRRRTAAALEPDKPDDAAVDRLSGAVEDDRIQAAWTLTPVRRVVDPRGDLLGLTAARRPDAFAPVSHDRVEGEYKREER